VVENWKFSYSFVSCNHKLTPWGDGETVEDILALFLISEPDPWLIRWRKSIHPFIRVFISKIDFVKISVILLTLQACYRQTKWRKCDIRNAR